MTLPDTPLRNGDARAAVFALLDGDPTMRRQDLSAALGGTPGERRCGELKAEWTATRAATAPGAPPPPRTATGALRAPEPPSVAPQRQAAPPPRPRERRQGPADVLDRYGRPAVSWGLTAIALLLSYSHMRHLAELAGVSWAPVVPLVVDGLMAAALLCLRRHRGYWPARLALGFSLLGALALNGLAERPDLVAMADVRLGWALLVPATAAFGVHLVGKR
jgi:hypothetical protein